MTLSKTFVAIGAIAGLAVSAGGAWAHTSIGPHAHPHGHSMLMGDDTLLVAMVAAAAIVGGLALAIGRRRDETVRVPRKQP